MLERKQGLSFEPMLPSEAEVERVRQMTADQRVRVAHSLWLQVWHATAAGVRARHPEWSEALVADGVRELLRGRTS